MRFFAAFGVVALLVVGGMAALAFLITQYFGGGGQVAVLVWIAGCSLSLALPALGVALAMRAFRGIARPLADVMAAAEAVGDGDLSVRVPEQGAGEFARLGRAFNDMAAELERADEQRRNLTADVAHELRTPLHIIQGNLEGLLDGVYQPTGEHVSAMLDETRLLARLIDDLTTLSLAESGQLALEKAPVNVADLLADVATSFSGQAQAAGVSLSVDGGADIEGLTIHADAGRLDQVLGNLVVNALRHTPRGGSITLSSARVPGGVRLVVADTGTGIPPADLPFIFDRFWRGDPARTHSGGAGGGLGLAIARQLVRLHAGRIEAHSDGLPGKGATFTLELPESQ